MKRSAIYARYSSDRQSCRSIDDQVALCRIFADREGWTIVGIYSDFEISAATVHRPEFTRLVADAKARRFDVVLAEDTDRLARGEGDMPQLRRQLEFFGVDLHTCSDGKVTKLVAGLKGLTSSIFLDNLAQHTHRGLAGVVRDGRHPGGRAYGYSIVPGKPGELAIDDSQAEVVRRIFADYAAGKTPREIAAALNREDVAPPRGRRWNASTINGNLTRGHGILINPIYAGRIVWNRVRMVKNPATGRRVSRPNPPDQHQTAEAPQLRIVDAALFDRVQECKRRRGSVPAPRSRKPPRLFSGLLRCGCCGGGMTARGSDKTGRPRLECSVRKESGQCCNSRALYTDAVEREALEGLRAKLKAPKFLTAYVAEYNAERQRLAGHARGQKAKLERRAGAIEREIQRGADAIVKGIVDPESLRGRMAQLRAERDDVAAQLARAAEGDKVIALHPQAIERYRRDVELLARALNGGRSEVPQDAAESLRRLVAEVVVHVGAGYAAKWHVEIKGRLAELLQAPGIFPGLESVGMVVAGGRYRQSRTPNAGLFSISTAA